MLPRRFCCRHRRKTNCLQWFHEVSLLWVARHAFCRDQELPKIQIERKKKALQLMSLGDPNLLALVEEGEKDAAYISAARVTF